MIISDLQLAHLHQIQDRRVCVASLMRAETDIEKHANGCVLDLILVHRHKSDTEACCAILSIV
jgi:hypothetical protein